MLCPTLHRHEGKFCGIDRRAKDYEETEDYDKTSVTLCACHNIIQANGAYRAMSDGPHAQAAQVQLPRMPEQAQDGVHGELEAQQPTYTESRSCCSPQPFW